MNAPAKIIPADATTCIDPRLMFLERAAAQLALVEAGELEIESHP
jgi:hypothetical protein